MGQQYTQAERDAIVDAFLQDKPYQAAFEIADGITTEEMQAEYFNPDALMGQPEQIYRLNNQGRRYYYVYDKKGKPQFLQSVTTFLRDVIPIDSHLLAWIIENGKESEEIKEERSHYGTFLHIQLQKLAIARKYDLATLRPALRDYIMTEQLTPGFMVHEKELRKDIMAFAQFMLDYKVKPFAVELVLAHHDDGYAGAIDLGADIVMIEKGFFGETYKTGPKKGQPKESTREVAITCIIDNKSGRKGFFTEHRCQLECYRRAWNVNFPKKPIERIFNWAPKAWRGTVPTYTFTEQTGHDDLAPLDDYIRIAKRKVQKRIDNEIVVIEGVIDLDAGKLEGNITEYTLATLVEKRAKAKADDTPAEAAADPADTKPAKKPSKAKNSATGGCKRKNGTTVPKTK